MKKANVLKKSTDFERMIHQNTPYKYRDYIIYFERTDASIYHFGLSVGKKIGNAVMRNRIRRQLKSIIDENHYENGFNCIIIVGRGILKRSYQEMKENLWNAFTHLHILEGKNDEK